MTFKKLQIIITSREYENYKRRGAREEWANKIIGLNMIKTHYKNL